MAHIVSRLLCIKRIFSIYLLSSCLLNINFFLLYIWKALVQSYIYVYMYIYTLEEIPKELVYLKFKPYRWYFKTRKYSGQLIFADNFLFWARLNGQFSAFVSDAGMWFMYFIYIEKRRNSDISKRGKNRICFWWNWKILIQLDL